MRRRGAVRQAVTTISIGAAMAVGAAAPAAAQTPSCDQPGPLSWKGGAGSFTDSAKWSPECSPGPQHIVDIGGGTSPVDIVNVSGSVAGFSAGPGLRLHGGTLDVSGAFSLTTSNAAFDNHVDVSITVAGLSSLSGDGRLFFSPGAVIALNGPGTWTGGGQNIPYLALEGNAQLEIGGAFSVLGPEKRLEGSVGGRLRTTSTGSFMANGDALTLHALNLDDAGAVGAGAGRTLILDESALTLPTGGEVRGPGTTQITTATSDLILGGDAEVTQGGELDVTAGVVSGKGTLKGDGRWRFSGGVLDGDFETGGNLRFVTSGSAVKTVEAVDPGTGRLHLGGPSTIGGTGILQLRRPAVRLSNAGVMTIDPGAEIEATSCCVPFSNTGTIATGAAPGERTLDGVDVVSGGRIDLTGGRLNVFRLRQTGGELWQRGGVLDVTGRLPSLVPEPVALDGGVLAGTGTLEGPGVVSAGIVAPGDPTQDGSRGTLTIAGAYTQTAAGRLVADMANGDHDQLVSSGPLTLAGTLQARTTSGYAPAVGTRAPVVRGASRTGAFDTLEADDFAADRRWALEQIQTGADLTVVPKTLTNLPVAPTAATAAPAAPAVPAGQTVAAVRPLLAITVRVLPLRRALVDGLPITLRPSAAGTLRITLEIPRRGIVGRLSRNVRAGRSTMTVRFNRREARTLRSRRRVTVIVRATLTTRAGATTRTTKLTLRH